MIKKHISLTKQGKADLEKELAELIAQRPEITERIATARAFGDLSENEEYRAARGDQKFAENRIAEIEEILKNAKLIRGSSTGKVSLGSSVTVAVGAKTFTYTLVGPVEANPLEGKISNESPIGQALLGHQVGDVAELKTPKGITKYTIKAIE